MKKLRMVLLVLSVWVVLGVAGVLLNPVLDQVSGALALIRLVVYAATIWKLPSLISRFSSVDESELPPLLVKRLQIYLGVTFGVLEALYLYTSMAAQ